MPRNPKITGRSWKRQEEVLPTGLRGCVVCTHLDHGLLASRLLFKLPRGWYLQPKETNTERKVPPLWRESWKYLAEVLWQQYEVM